MIESQISRPIDTKATLFSPPVPIILPIPNNAKNKVSMKPQLTRNKSTSYGVNLEVNRIRSD